ncbi:CAP domain-containing protein [Lacinutrix sp. Bg11-31]|uniref:CAP domain-containing protein n=1 Tax=Lacinutrix sp. Bg11-31 TaxID=2057808 RepID=UPI000C307DC9|nr:CAP domain-containing protein [Lacinutrix sp. Bg11-31]AUC82557.1 CAP domain-containing protein [Lacinutrix sp. Bg11-31]
MKKLVLVAVLFSAFFMSCSVEEENTTPEEYKLENISVEYTQLDYEIAELINAYRISQGLNTLNILNAASKEATKHNQYMVNKGVPSHDFFYLRSQNLKESVNAKNVSENVGFGFSNAQSLVDAWINSEGHRQNIENPDFTDFGISTQQDEQGKNYFTNIFVKL